MSRIALCATFVVILSAGCTAQPGPSGLPTASQALSPNPSLATSPTPDPSATDVPTLEPFPVATAMAGVPAAIERVAWSGTRSEVGPNDTYVRHIYGGLLDHPPTIHEVYPDSAGYPRAAVAGDTLTIATAADGAVRLTVRKAADGAVEADIRQPGSDVLTFATDPLHAWVYAAIRPADGGVGIHRFAFDGSRDDLLVTLDTRFTPDGIPTERFDLTLDPDGILIVEACGKADGCRLWEIPPTATRAGSPRTLPGHPPIVCSIVGATREWIVVGDDASCSADTGDARLPHRAIRRSDGASHIITDDHIGPGPLRIVTGRTLLVAADPVYAGATVDVVTYDIESGRRSVLLRDLEPVGDEQTATVSSTILPGPWVLLQPWVLESKTFPTIPSTLLDLETRETIELPIGTSGWS